MQNQPTCSRLRSWTLHLCLASWEPATPPSLSHGQEQDTCLELVVPTNVGSGLAFYLTDLCSYILETDTCTTS